MDLLTLPGPIAGAAIGLFVVFLVWTTGKPLGCSTAYGNVCGMVSRQRFFREGKYETLNNWRLWFAIGLPLGGLIGVLISGEAWTPTLDMGAHYDALLPASAVVRALIVFAGGVAIGLGARIAGGCQSGHAIMGMSLLNWPSFVAGGAFFVGGIIAVQTLVKVAG